MNDPIETWETRLRVAAQGLAYPPTPDIAGAVAAKIAAASPAAARRRSLERRWQVALAGAAVILLLLAGLLAVPQVRAAVLEFLQIGGIRILLPAATATPASAQPAARAPTPALLPTRQPLPTPTPAPPVDLSGLQGETTLEAALRQASFPVRLPAYPAALGLPDRVFLQDAGGDLLIFVWNADDQPGSAALILYQIAPESWVGHKYEPSAVQPARVNDHDAVWAEGPYMLLLSNGQIEQRRLIAGKALIWEENRITYRLESYLDPAVVIKIAESLADYP